LRKFVSEDGNDQINMKQMEMTVDVMAHSLVYWTQDVLKRDLMKPGGKIYAMTSSGGSRVIEFYGAVSAAKACLESHVRQLALELGQREIAVNALLAGVTDTPALRKIPKNEDLIKMALMRNPQGKLTEPKDIADFILDNYKRNSHWMTGCIVHIDGGETVSGF
jgi:enoyl-[acyl-carrier protein] reductase III